MTKGITGASAGKVKSSTARRKIVPHSGLGLERIVFFSDAVIAIAITLLALEIRLPDVSIPISDLGIALSELMPRFISFCISFFVIGLFWLSHHRMFEYIHAYDRGLLWLNLLFLFLVIFLPFPSSVLGRYPGETLPVVLYASVVVLMALVRIWLWWYVYYRAHLVRSDTDPRVGQHEYYRAAATAIVFGISILIAFWNPDWAMYFWITLLPISIYLAIKLN